MTSRFLTIEFTSAGARRKRLAIKVTLGPSAVEIFVLHLLSPLLPVVVVQRKQKMTTSGS